MPCNINVQNFNANGVTENANLDIGNNVQNSHTANSKSVGACFSFGNTSPSVAHMLNNNCDPDISDQGQIDNTSNS